jgi:hypothetical protein
MSLRIEHADPNNPAAMSPDDRRDELASIFARGLCRIPRRPCDVAEVDQFAAESAPLGLELSSLPRPDRDRS